MDPYAPCPCGSGKKLKFCCQEIIGEMEKIERLQENNQPRMALQLLEKIEKAHPDNSWIATHKGLALIDDQRSDEAAAGILNFLRTEPDHPFANAIYAIASYNAEGYPASKKAVHRAFRRSIREYPELVATLAASIASNQLADSHYMAAREHMALALRVGTEEQRRESVLALLDFDGDAGVPYPLRGAHHLPEFNVEERHADAVHKSKRLAACGCFQEAADILCPVAEAEGPAGAWHAVGLLRAWDGDEQAAAAALHRAAAAYDDVEPAVECETLAQLLDQLAEDNTAKLRMRRYRVESVSRLLTVLDSAGRIVRVDRNDGPEGNDSEPAARFMILDRDVPEDAALGDLDFASAPQSLARLTAFDRSDDEPALVFIAALEGERLRISTELLEQLAGDLITAIPPDDPDGDEPIFGIVPREQLAYYRDYYVPPKTPGEARRRIQAGHWESILNDGWFNVPLAALDGRTPRDAAADASARVKLAAAVNVLDVFCGSRGYICPVNDLRGRLGLPEPTPLACDQGQVLSTLSLLGMQRLDLATVPDAQIESVLQRALLVRHPSHLYRVLRYLMDHNVGGDNPPPRDDVCATLVDVCRASLRRGEALEWVQRGRELADGEFETTLQWKMRELGIRVDDPDDPKRIPLLKDLWETYGTKLPSLRDHLTELVTMLDIEPPWNTAILTPAGVGHPEGVWSGAESSAAAGEKKLWLPGDD